MVDVERVKKILQEKINPMLAFEGGGIDLVSVEGGKVKVKLSGACAMCPMRQFTVKQFVETILKREVPDVESVETA